ncbi:hypothetical protein SUGI_0999740 [Cryptomeria japonica]|uniref:pentatricopeptide repeat-containing protein At5g15010, mitochondrial n=1 Tax=Cryptomeria japonica TaxID=3369 RepID=UPI002414B474|nr:pentatricopeptide repeat-containing protein At5g15010, mitochondrial [Cryptomeria japonica]GLJ47368.1 hypothetical protein SUGI_0999740 [Cryptomeria japonica]
MAIHFTKRSLVLLLDITCSFACKSCTISSVYRNPHIWFHTDSTTLCHLPSFKPVHNDPINPYHRWVSSDARYTPTEEDEEEEEEDDDSGEIISNISEDGKVNDEDVILKNIGSIIGLSMQEGMSVLNDCEFISSSSLVQKLLCRTQSDWRAALTVFQWAGSRENYSHTISVYHTMISILGMHKKFSVAWVLIREMHEKAMVTHHTFKIVIQRYAATEAVDKAIKTFHAMEKFKLAADYNDFLHLLRALCRYQYFEEAEELIYFNKEYFPLATKSFNVLLNGWGNILVDVYQVKRLWNDMYNLCITPDVSSYTTIICCLSKADRFYDVVRFYDEMKKKGFTPNLKVYNAVICVLAKHKFIKEALHLFNRIREMGFNPNAVTYISLINHLCLAWEAEDAYRILDEMIQKGFVPSIRIYYSFFRFVKDGDAIFDLFDRMEKTGCAPTMEFYLLSIRRCCSWGQYENAFKLLNVMEKHGICIDDSSSVILQNGFFLNGKSEEPCKCYKEMKAEGFCLEPKADKLFESWIASRRYAPLQLHQNFSKERRDGRQYSNTLHKMFNGR